MRNGGNRKAYSRTSLSLSLASLSLVRSALLQVRRVVLATRKFLMHRARAFITTFILLPWSGLHLSRLKVGPIHRLGIKRPLTWRLLPIKEVHLPPPPSLAIHRLVRRLGTTPSLAV